MTPKLQRLQGALAAAGFQAAESLNELTLEVSPAQYLESCRRLRDEPSFGFEQLIDLCGLDYSTYGGRLQYKGRFAVALHLLSHRNNWRLRVRCAPESDEQPVLPSLVDTWPSANWYEREAFDLFGIVFDGHPDLRRILTDYGFVGHPFRKDFPVSGHVEMRYDPEQRRVVYQPVTIDPREVTPRIVREEHFGEGRG